MYGLPRVPLPTAARYCITRAAKSGSHGLSTDLGEISHGAVAHEDAECESEGAGVGFGRCPRVERRLGVVLDRQLQRFRELAPVDAVGERQCHVDPRGDTGAADVVALP